MEFLWRWHAWHTTCGRPFAMWDAAADSDPRFSDAVTTALQELVADRLRRFTLFGVAGVATVAALQAFVARTTIVLPVILHWVALGGLFLLASRLLSRQRWRRQPRAVGMVFIALAHGLMGLGIVLGLSADLASFLLTISPLVASALVPWGVWPQVGVSGSAVASYVAAAFAAERIFGASVTAQEVPLLLATLISLAVAREVNGIQREAIARQKASEEVGGLYRDAVENAAEAIYRTDANGRIVFANPAAAHLFAVDPRSLIGRTLWEFVAPQVREEVRAYYAAQYRERRPRTFREILLINGRGEQLWVSQTVQLWRREREVEGLHLVARDITDRVRIVEQLRQSEARFRSTLERAPIGIALVAPGGRFLRVNSALCQMLGFSQEELLQRDFQSITYPEDLGPDLERVRECLEGKRDSYELEKRYVCKDGRLLTARLLVGLVRDSWGHPVHFVSLIEDVTQRRVMERALQESEKRLRAIVQAAFDAIVVVDDQNRVAFWNNAAEKCFGWRAEEVVGRDIASVLSVDGEDTDLCELLRCCSQMVRGFRRELVVRSLKQTLPVAVEASFATTVFGGRTHVVMILCDVSARREMQLELQRAKEEAEAANRAKTFFLANMSHEIRTPLTGVLGMLDLLQGTPLTREQREYVETARRSGQALFALLQDLLDLTRIESGKVELRPEVVDCRALLADLQCTFAPLAEARGLRFEVETLQLAHPVVEVDSLRLRQILVNLLGNALKFTEKGYVRLHASVQDVEENGACVLHFAVEDSGPGIPPEDLARMFLPFEQGRHSLPTGGAGLGLAIAKSLAEAMGGSLRAQSEVGRGSTFSVSVPAKLVHAGASTGLSVPASGPAEPAKVVGKGRRVLIAEDHPVNQMLIRRVLETDGYSVAVVEDGRAALEALETQRFDALVVDVQMPKLDGVELTRRIREQEGQGYVFCENGSRLVIVALTAHAWSEDRERCLRAGANAYLSKPVSAKVLRETLAAALAAAVSPRQDTVHSLSQAATEIDSLNLGATHAALGNG